MPETGSPYVVEEIVSEEQLTALEAEWERLSQAAAHANIFASHPWFRAWSRRFTHDHPPGSHRLSVLGLWQDGVLRGISPLVIRKVSRLGQIVRRVQFLDAVNDYNDLVLGDDAGRQTQAVVDFLSRQQESWDLVDLRSLRSSDAAAELTSALARSPLKHLLLPDERCPYLRIDGPARELAGRATGSGRVPPLGAQQLERKQRRLERMAGEGLRVRIVENPQEEPRLLDRCIALETQKRVRRKAVQPFLGKYPEVFQEIIDTLGRRGWLFVAAMELGDRLLAYQLGFRCGRKLWHYQTAYDHAFSQLSPGTMLIPAILDYGFSNGYEEYDFLRGEESYKMIWSTGCHETTRALIWNQRPKSRACALAVRAKARAL